MKYEGNIWERGGDLWGRGAHFPVDLIVQAQVVSLASRDADIAVRMSRPEGNSLIARKLPEIGQGLFASAAWLGVRDPADIDLAQERLIVAPLISHVMSPRQCQDAYDGLTTKKDEYTAVVFDWSEFR